MLRIEQFGFRVVKAHVNIDADSKSRPIDRRALEERLAGGGFFAMEIMLDAHELAVNGRSRVFISGIADTKRTAFLSVNCPVRPGDGVFIEHLVADLANLGSLGYGIGFEWKREPDPLLHVLGITHGLPRTEEEEALADHDSLWFEERIARGGASPAMRHLAGYFRDVYELNLLNRAHLNAPLEGTSFAEVVRSHEWGSLEELAKGNWLWRVPRSAVGEVRRRLSGAGLLLCQ
jgi:hypothetical protein